MNRARTTGVVLIAAGVVELLLFAYGVARRSYLAIALPVAAAMTTVAALTFWVGWTMLTMEDEEEEPQVAPSQ
jgi:hypothetical protein